MFPQTSNCNDTDTGLSVYQDQTRACHRIKEQQRATFTHDMEHASIVIHLCKPATSVTVAATVDSEPLVRTALSAICSGPPRTYPNKLVTLLQALKLLQDCARSTAQQIRAQRLQVGKSSASC